MKAVQVFLKGVSVLLLVLLLWLGILAWTGAGLTAELKGLPAPKQDTQAVSPEIDQLFEAAFAATNRGDFAQAETLWSQLLERQPENPALWSNRGNARVSQHKLQQALTDYAEAIRLAPNAPDPYLNRGAALEGLGEWQAAIADYERVLELDPYDAAAYNNRGNAEAGLGDWQRAVADYRHATELAPDYAFAQANYALSLYQVGETEAAVRLMRALVRKYPKFPDMRAALSAILWTQGHHGEAESHWVAVQGLDPRYGDVEWVKTVRRWPPAAVAALERFLSLG
ncbi:MAG: tetratricopeptide repeat protein [Thermostichus sp. HHBFW_bins_43]